MTPQERLEALNREEAQLLEQVAKEEKLAALEEEEKALLKQIGASEVEQTAQKNTEKKPEEIKDPYLRYLQENNLRMPEKDEGFFEGVGKGMLHNVQKDVKTLARNVRHAASGFAGLPVDAAAFLLGQESPQAQKKFGKAIDVLTEGYTAPEDSSYGRTEEAIASSLGGMGPLGAIGKAAQGVKHAPKALTAIGEFLSAGTAPTMGNVLGTAAASGAAQQLSEHPEYIPTVAGTAGAAYLGVKAKKELPKLAGKIGEKIGFDTDVYELLNEIPGWSKVQTLGDYVKSLSLKKIENQIRKVPYLGSELEERAAQKGKMVSETLGQESIDPLRAPELTYKGAKAAEKKYEETVGKAWKTATRHIKEDKDKLVPITNVEDYFNISKADITTEGGEELLNETLLGRYENLLKKMQKPKVHISKEDQSFFNHPDFKSLPEDIQQKIREDTIGKAVSHEGQATLPELYKLRRSLGRDINWAEGQDLELKGLYHAVNTDLEQYFASHGESALEGWKKFNKTSTDYLKKEAKNVRGMKKLYESDEEMKAFLKTLPTKSGAKNARIVMSNLGEDAPELLHQIINHVGQDNGKWNPMKVATWWNKLGAKTQQELLSHSGINAVGQTRIRKIFSAVDHIKTTLQQNLNTSDTSTFENIRRLAVYTAGIPYGLWTGNVGLAATNLVALAGVKGASRYIFANPKFSKWIYSGMKKNNLAALEEWKKGISKFPDAPDAFRKELDALFKTLKESKGKEKIKALKELGAKSLKSEKGSKRYAAIQALSEKDFSQEEDRED